MHQLGPPQQVPSLVEAHRASVAKSDTLFTIYPPLHMVIYGANIRFWPTLRSIYLMVATLISWTWSRIGMCEVWVPFLLSHLHPVRLMLGGLRWMLGELRLMLGELRLKLKKLRLKLGKLRLKLGELRLQLGKTRLRLGELRLRLGELRLTLGELS